MLPRTNTQSCPDRASTFHPAPEEAGPDEAGAGQEWGGQASRESFLVFSSSAEQPGPMTSQHTLEEEEGHS